MSSDQLFPKSERTEEDLLVALVKLESKWDAEHHTPPSREDVIIHVGVDVTHDGEDQGMTKLLGRAAMQATFVLMGKVIGTNANSHDDRERHRL